MKNIYVHRLKILRNLLPCKKRILIADQVFCPQGFSIERGVNWSQEITRCSKSWFQHPFHLLSTSLCVNTGHTTSQAVRFNRPYPDPLPFFFWFPAGFPYILQNSGELCAVSSDVIAAIRCNSQTKTFILVRTFLTFWSKGREKQSRGWKRTMSMERYFSTQLKQRLNQTGKYVFLWYGNFCMLWWKSKAKKEKINKNLVLRTSASLKGKKVARWMKDDRGARPLGSKF